MCVTISLRGEYLDPDNVSSYLSQKPSFSFRKGDKCNSRKGEMSSKFRNSGCWIYHSSDTIDCEDVIVHVNHVVEMLQQSTKYIRDDNKVETAEIDIFLSLEVSNSKSNMGNYRLSREHIMVLQEQGLELVLSYDAYCEPK